MQGERSYPRYHTYETVGKTPSLLSQEYPRPLFSADEIYYPREPLLESYFSPEESRKFGAACLCGFLEDTVEVEHCLVIPAIASIRRLPYQIPPTAEQDLYKLATDEGFHAEQSQQFLTDLRAHFSLIRDENHRTPLFLRRLESQRSSEQNPIYRDLITVLNGVVTETRISIELSKFAADKSLAEPVRIICFTHAADESIHSSQFRALGQWLWGEFDEETKAAAARFLTASTIARSMPDIDRISLYFHQSAKYTEVESRELVYSTFTVERLINRLLLETKSTRSFLNELGVEQYFPFAIALERETEKLRSEASAFRHGTTD